MKTEEKESSGKYLRSNDSEEERNMPYLTTVEQRAIEQGLQQERELILEAVDERFGEVPSSISETITQIEGIA